MNNILNSNPNLLLLGRGAVAALVGALCLACGQEARALPGQVVHGGVPAPVSNHSLQPLQGLAATNRLDLAIALPVRHAARLSALLNEVYDPASPNYRKFLTPDQFTAAFGPTEQDYQAVLAFARTHGLRVSATHANRMIVDVNAAVPEIEAAFHVHLGLYQHPTEQRTFYAPDSEPTLDLGVAVLGISGLNNYALPRPRCRVKPLTGSQGTAPNGTGSGTGGTFMGYDFRSAYIPGAAVQGTGQSVGLLEFDGYTANDIAYYETKAGLPSVTLSNVLLNGVTGRPSGGEVEVCLDIEVAIAMAPGLDKVYVYEAANWHDVLNRMATDNLAKQLSCSWYIPGGGADAVADQIWQQMAAQGQSFFNASGDSDAYSGPIDFPGDSPYITQVGGTTLTTTGPGGAWLAEQVWNWGGSVGSSGGVSTSYPIPYYQTNINMSACQGSTTRRNTPDVAMPADNIYVRVDGQDADVGGTSCSAPLWAGFTALINQAARASGSAPVGFVNPAIYTLGQTPGYAANFHDITVGNNESPTSPTKFVAVPGYDLCTGYGSPLSTNLIYTLGVPEPMRIAPDGGLLFTGPAGGPIGPVSLSFSLTNKASGTLNWSVSKDVNWLTLSPSSGTLTGGGPATNVVVRPNVLASNFGPGSYTATLRFTNLNDAFGQTRQVTLAIVTPPVITSQPASQSLFQGMAASFTVGTASNALQYYQWHLDNGVYQTTLTDGGAISGSATAALTVSNVASANVGGYWVVITNAAGSATSSLAFLSIVPWRPVITVPPVSQTVLPGSTTTFTVGAVGTQPFTYAWQLNGVNLTNGGAFLGATTSTLTVSNVTAASTGTYSVVISNSLGFASSAGASLALVPVTAPGVALNTLYSFAGSSYGLNPFAGLLQGTDGSFYGTALSGGANSDGTVFRMTTNGVVSLLHSFNYNTDGAVPYSALAQANNGLVYGVNFEGGQYGYGTVYRMTTNGGSVLTLAALNYDTSGGLPVAGLAHARDGYLYGPTLEGGLSGDGTLLRVYTGGGFTPLSSFNGQNGLESSSLLVQGQDGNLYGTAEGGGTNGGWGTVFRATTAGVITPLVSFNYNNGAIPVAGLVQDTDGTLYGTTYYGGTNGVGTVFKLTLDGTLTPLYAFTGGPDGGNPFGGLLLSSDGNLYGTTESGGTYGDGTVFRVSPDGVLLTLVNFDGYQGSTPESVLTQGADGNLYGTTPYGGQTGEGAIYRITINSPLQITHQPQTQNAFLGDTVSFNVATSGSLPVSYQWRKNGKNLSNGGSLSGSNARTLLLTNVAAGDAANYSVVVSNSYGALTSVTARLELMISPPYIVAGPDDQTVLAGSTATFSVDADGDAPLYYQWQKNGANLADGGGILGSSTSVLTINNASAASAGTYSVIVSNALDFDMSYGALLTVVPLTQPGASFSSLRNFAGGTGGFNPYAGVVQGRDGNLYGTTLNGGTGSYGLVFRLVGGSYTVMHSFTNGPDGATPYAGLVQATDGNFYGAAFGGGNGSVGTVFKTTSAGLLTPVYQFLGGADGAAPAASLIQGADGKLYGTAYQGGTNNLGTVFSLTTSGALTPLYSFNDTNGAYPEAPLLQATNGLLYGTTATGGTDQLGTVFSLTTNGVLTTLVNFTGDNGSFPLGGLIQGSDGAFYGTASEGGTNGGFGTVFRLTADGTLRTLYAFGYDDGAYPAAGLVQATDGNLYGTTFEGGWGGLGTMFRLTTNGVLTTVLWFNGANGANPEAPVIQARDGSFYGTAQYGGVAYNGASSTGDGVVFRLVLPMFLSGTFAQATATAGVPYVAALTANSIRPSGDAVSFAKLSGPAWLQVGSDGTLSGTPAAPDIGTNSFGVSLFDNNGWSCAATMLITVAPNPVITASIVRNGGNLWLTWTGRTPPYQVLQATRLANPVWVNLAGPVTTNTLLLSPTAPAAYYRILGQ